MPHWLGTTLFVLLLVALVIFVIWGLLNWLTEKHDIDREIERDKIGAIMDQPFDD